MYTNSKFTNLYVDKHSTTHRYNLPAITSDNPIKQQALNVVTSNVLKMFQDSLNNDGVIMVSEMLDTENYRGYLNLIVEAAVAESIASLESDIYASDTPCDGNELVDTVVNYMVSENYDYINDVYNFSYLTLTGVIVDVVKIAKTLGDDDIVIDTFTIHRVEPHKTAVDVKCYVEVIPH